MGSLQSPYREASKRIAFIRCRTNAGQARRGSTASDKRYSLGLTGVSRGAQPLTALELIRKTKASFGHS